MSNFFSLMTLDRSPDYAARHFNEIDFVKAIAIIAVIGLHALPANMLYAIFAPFHIWHAVPIFLVIAGMNSTLSSAKRGKFVFSKEYSAGKCIKYFQKIILPFSIVWLFEVVVLACAGKISTGKIIYSFFAGGLGPGSYFTPVFIQHLMLFPLILWLKNTLQAYNHYLAVIVFFLLSLLLEWLCIVFAVPEWLYRLLYVRYLFAAFLGSYLVSPGFKKSMTLFLAILSGFYIACLSYSVHSFNTAMIIFPSWGFQHAPAYFYTVFLVGCLWHFYYFFQKLDVVIMFIGKATYHIFLLQMVWFKMTAHAVQGFIPNIVIRLAFDVSVCLLLGCFFFKMHEYGLKAIKTRLAQPENQRVAKHDR